MFRVPLTYIPTYGFIKLGTTLSRSFYAVAIFNSGSLVGRLLGGVLPIQIFITGFVSIVLTGVIAFCWIPVSSWASFAVWCAMIGLVTGAYNTACPTACSHPVISPIEVLGTRLGQVYFAAGLGTWIGTPIAGALVDVEKRQFLHAQIFMAVVAFASGVALVYPAIVAIRYDKRRQEIPGAEAD